MAPPAAMTARSASTGPCHRTLRRPCIVKSSRCRNPSAISTDWRASTPSRSYGPAGRVMRRPRPCGRRLLGPGLDLLDELERVLSDRGDRQVGDAGGPVCLHPFLDPTLVADHGG